MLVVTVEVWPGGHILQRHVIGTMNLANISELSEESDYQGYLDGDFVEVDGHRRADGAWVLIKKALEYWERSR